MYEQDSIPLSSLGSFSMKTGDSGESGMEEGCVVDNRETTLHRLLSPVSRMSQWSDTDELVDPKRKHRQQEKHPSPQTQIKPNSLRGRRRSCETPAGWTAVKVYMKVASTTFIDSPTWSVILMEPCTCTSLCPKCILPASCRSHTHTHTQTLNNIHFS